MARSHMVLWLGLLAAAWATADAAGNIKPYPRGAFPSVGRFADVCSLQCRMSPLGNGDRGITVNGTLYPWGNRTCGVRLDADKATNLGPADPGGLDGVLLQEQALTRRVVALARSLGAARARQIATDIEFTPVTAVRRGLCGADQEALIHEPAIVDKLGLQRNSISGQVMRRVGVYDVLAVVHVSVGVCGTQKCHDVTAVDTTGSQTCGITCSGGNASCSCQGKTIVTTIGVDGVERSVSMLQRRYLSLGRGLLADTSWLGAAASVWGLTAGLGFSAAWSGTSGEPPPSLPQRALRLHWASLRGVPATNDSIFNNSFADSRPRLTNTTTAWPQLLAAVFCASPATSFVTRASVCDGIPPTRYETEPRVVGGTVVQRRQPIADSLHAQWDVVTNPEAASEVPSVNNALVLNATMATFKESPYPPASSAIENPALTAYGGREINSASATERAVASSTRRRLVYLPVRSGSTGTSDEGTSGLLPPALEKALQADTARLSVAYDRSAFAVDAPSAPAAVQDVVLAGLVVLPEAVALVAAPLTVRSAWRVQELIALGLLFATGVVSLSAIASLAVAERSGAAWRAATVRTCVGARFGVGIDGAKAADLCPQLAGTELALSEAYILIARTGYHPGRLLGLAIAFSAVYVVCAAAAAVTVIRAKRAPGLQAAIPEAASARNGTAAEAVALAAATRGRRWRRWVPRGWRRRSRPATYAGGEFELPDGGAD